MEVEQNGGSQSYLKLWQIAFNMACMSALIIAWYGNLQDHSHFMDLDEWVSQTPSLALKG